MAWEYKGGTGRWQEYVNTETGESTIKEHKITVIAEYCSPDEHYFVPIKNTSREVRCKKCGFVTHYVLGLQKLKDGKITTS